VSIGGDGSQTIRWCLDTETPALVEGALRGATPLRLVFDSDTTNEIVAYVERTGPYDPLRFWAAAAGAGWTGRRVRKFLSACATGSREDAARAAASSLRNEYMSYRVP
jgi:hypothetical protein